MDSESQQEMEKLISSWNRETLLKELTERGDDFSTEARAFMHAELLRRGVTEEEIQLAAERYRAHLSERQFTHDELVVIRTFDAMPVAEAARDELEQAGIPCLLHGSDHLLFGPGLLRVGPDPITIKVAEHDAARARQVLESFALPLSDDEADEGEEE